MKRSTHGLEVASTELVASHVWHWLRPALARRLARRCTRCVVSERYARLDDEGVCEHCRALETAPRGGSGDATAGDDEGAALEGALEGALEAATGAGGAGYDALALVSGGKDSAYMLHRLRRAHPDLRLLALLVDNGFMSPFALDNAARVVGHFGLPYVRYRLDPRLVKAAFRYTLLHLDRQTGYSTTDLMDGCMTFDTGMQLAARYRIPLVLCGLARVQTQEIFGQAPLELTRAAYRRALEVQLGKPLEDVVAPELRPLWYQPEHYPEAERPRMLLPFIVWSPGEDEVLAEVERLGLMDRRRSRPLVTNNALIPVIGMAEVARFGYCSWEVEFGRMVREGRSARRYWRNMFEMLEYSTRTGRFINRTVEETLDALDLSKSELGIGR